MTLPKNTVDRGRLTVEPVSAPKYTLSELLANCQQSDLAPSEADNAWLSESPKGKELI